MKKNLILFTILACNVSVYAQSRSAVKHFRSLITEQLPETRATVYQPGKMMTYYWDSTNVSWVYNDSTRTFYNSMANATHSTKYFNGGMGKDTSIYNNSGLLGSRVGFSWNGSNWDTASVETYTYNSQNQVTNDQYYWYQSGSISSGYLDVYTYNSSNQMITNVSSNLDNGSWVNSYKAALFYNGNGELNKYVSYGWDNTNNLWDKTDSIINIVFDYWGGNIDNSRLLTYLYAEVSGTQTLDSMFYDSNNNQVKFVSYEMQNGVWVLAGTQKDTYVYDSNNNILEQAEKIHYNGAPIASNGYKWVYSDFAPYNVSAAGITAVAGKSNGSIVYPNPNNGTFKIKGEMSKTSKIEMYSLTGEKVYSIAVSELPESGELTVSNAVKGVYFVKIFDKEKVQIEKVVVQ